MFSSLRRPSAPDTVPVDIETFAPPPTGRKSLKSISVPKVQALNPSVLQFRVSRKRFIPDSFGVTIYRQPCRPEVSTEWLLDSAFECCLVDKPALVATLRVVVAKLTIRVRRLSLRPSVSVVCQLMIDLDGSTASVSTYIDGPLCLTIDVSLVIDTVCQTVPNDPDIIICRPTFGSILAPGVTSIPVLIRGPRTLGTVYYKFQQTPLDRAATVSHREAAKPRFVETGSIDSLFYILLARHNWDARIADLNSLLAAYPSGKTPYPFQFEGIKFLFSQSRALLSDEMGLGKTIQAILAMRSRIHSGRVQRVLIVCPKSLLPTWEREVNEWAPELSVTLVHGSNRKRSLARKHHVYITNYESVTREICDDSGSQRPSIPEYDLLIVDEIQNLKNISTSRTRAAIGIKAKQRWGLSGTPMENSFRDYRTIWRVIDPESANRRLADSEFLHWTKPFVMRREKASVLKDLPDTVTQTVYVDLEGAQRSHYRLLESHSKRDAEVELRNVGIHAEIKLRFVLALIVKLKKQCVIDESSGISAKFEWLKEHLATIQAETHGREKLLLFTQFPNLVVNQWKFQQEFQEFRPMVYYGGTSESDRNTFQDRFQADDDCKLALVGIQAGGTGLTLTRANHLVFLDQWWNPAVMAQAAARIHRIGQTRSCTVTYLMARGTIEDKIYRMLEQKQSQSNHLLSQLTSSRSVGPEDFRDFSGALSMKELLSVLGVSQFGSEDPPDSQCVVEQ